MRGAFPWILTIALATAIDLTVRFGGEFRLERVLRTEAAVFLAAGAICIVLLRRPPRATGWLRVLQAGLAGGFLLAGIRAALWTAGTPVVVANMCISALAVAAGGIAWARRKRRVSVDS